MKISKEIIVEQLKYIYQLLEINLKSRVIIKSWCITVWLGIIIIILKEISLESPLIIFIPILAFWALEATEGAKTKLYRRQAIKIEERLFEENFESNEVSDIFIISGYKNNFSKLEKIHTYISSIIWMGSLTPFYLILSIVSAILIFIIF